MTLETITYYDADINCVFFIKIELVRYGPFRMLTSHVSKCVAVKDTKKEINKNMSSIYS